MGALTNALMRSMDRQAIFSKLVQRGAHETTTLSIDPSLASRSLNWEPRLTGDAILRLTAEWYGSFIAGKNMKKITDNQINNYRDAAQ